MSVIKSIRVMPSWGNSPARTRRKTGEVFINADYVGRNFSPGIWKFILKHEEGHIALDTSDEDAADAYASRHFFNEGGSHRESVRALVNVLPFTTPQHHTRVRNQIVRALKDDCKRNKHKPSCMLAETITGVTMGTVVARGVNGLLDKARDQFSSYEGSVRIPVISSVGIGENTVSVLDDFTPVDCGARPVPANCSGGPLKRRRCNDGNKDTLNAWNKCNAQNNEGLKQENESKLLQQNIDAETAKAKLSTDTTLKLQQSQAAAEKAASEEETKQKAQSKTPLVLITGIVVFGVAVALYFLFKTPAKTA